MTSMPTVKDEAALYISVLSVLFWPVDVSSE